MKPNLTALAACIVVASLGATGAVSGANLSSLPPVQTQGAVSFITGGVGEDEADAFRQAAATYPLELQFAQRARPKDQFLADVKVAIRDRSGNVLLDTASDGPFLLADLPAGTYKVEANFRGEPKAQTVEIRPGKHQRTVFVWTAQSDSSDRLSVN